MWTQWHCQHAYTIISLGKSTRPFIRRWATNERTSIIAWFHWSNGSFVDIKRKMTCCGFRTNILWVCLNVVLYSTVPKNKKILQSCLLERERNSCSRQSKRKPIEIVPIFRGQFFGREVIRKYFLIPEIENCSVEAK